jgi:hypothetical protein
MTFLSLRASCFGSLPPGGAPARRRATIDPDKPTTLSATRLFPSSLEFQKGLTPLAKLLKLQAFGATKPPSVLQEPQRGVGADEYDEFELWHGSTLLFSAETKDS